MNIADLIANIFEKFFSKFLNFLVCFFIFHFPMIIFLFSYCHLPIFLACYCSFEASYLELFKCSFYFTFISFTFLPPLLSIQFFNFLTSFLSSTLYSALFLIFIFCFSLSDLVLHPVPHHPLVGVQIKRVRTRPCL